MARNITSAFNTAIGDSVVRPIFAVELDFSDGMLRFWNGYGDLTMTAGGSSKTFTGSGDLLNISAVTETTEVQATGITIQLTGIKSSLISSALSANYTNRDATVYLGLFDSSKNVIADVYTLFRGKMDVLKIQEENELANISLQVESRLIVLDRPIQRRYTTEDQQINFSGDLGFEFIPDLQDKELVWGKEVK